MGPLRFSLRLILTVLYSLILWLTAAVAKLFIGLWPRVRYRLVCRLMRVWGHGIARIWGMRIRVEGTPPTAPFFLLSNHISYTDIILVCAVTPAWFISKSEVAAWPGIGALTRMANTIFIDRETRRDVGRMNRLIADLIEDGGAVGFFPEGTTTDGTDVLPFKPSLLQPAVEMDMPVTLAAIAYRTRPGQPPAEEHVAWVGDTEFAPHAKTLLSGRGFDVRIRFADEPLHCTSRKELAVQSRDRIAAMVQDLRESWT
jgi:1-acyl-sn-glycerol-3-phosphate acyltransferase